MKLKTLFLLGLSVYSVNAMADTCLYSVNGKNLKSANCTIELLGGGGSSINLAVSIKGRTLELEKVEVSEEQPWKNYGYIGRNPAKYFLLNEKQKPVKDMWAKWSCLQDKSTKETICLAAR